MPVRPLICGVLFMGAILYALDYRGDELAGREPQLPYWRDSLCDYGEPVKVQSPAPNVAQSCNADRCADFVRC